METTSTDNPLLPAACSEPLASQELSEALDKVRRVSTVPLYLTHSL